MPIKMNAEQTKRSEATLAKRIELIQAADSLEAAMIAKAVAEGALEGMVEMGYSVLGTEAHAARKRFKTATATKRTPRVQSNGAWTLQCLREMMLPEPLIQAMGSVLAVMDRARTRDGVERARAQVRPLLAGLRSRDVIDVGDETITREVMDDAAERCYNDVLTKGFKPVPYVPTLRTSSGS